MLLPRLITLRRPTSEPLSPEDIFSSTLGSIFTDDLQNQHGDSPDTVIIYKNRHLGELEFTTADVDGEEQRRKFAHYLWNAGVLAAELVGGRLGVHIGEGESERRIEEVDELGEGMRDWWWLRQEEESFWSVEDQTVLEVGAGVGLAGIVSALSKAKEVAISDYPAPPILEAIKTNVKQNVPEEVRSRISVEGHQWGEFGTPFAEANAHRFTRIIAADCLWMPWEHESLARSMLHFLSHDPEARVLCIAGFHTGRAKVAPFFEEVVPSAGLEIEDLFEMDANGERRPWEKERDGGAEHIGERKKWLTVARLRRPVQP